MYMYMYIVHVCIVLWRLSSIISQGDYVFAGINVFAQKMQKFCSC